ncbi:hypothetical protein EPI10_015706 [Gossypium australe]|uniref:Uncharacterized protein n=1 Tax=Gossypium australe TaxID=47621 RepID=A0A5B6VLI8_9ROSI|nr:hypothetical protein EPI10_015706 [Gossypium australe]
MFLFWIPQLRKSTLSFQRCLWAAKDYTHIFESTDNPIAFGFNRSDRKISDYDNVSLDQDYLKLAVGTPEFSR